VSDLCRQTSGRPKRNGESLAVAITGKDTEYSKMWLEKQVLLPWVRECSMLSVCLCVLQRWHIAVGGASAGGG